ncbi:sodium:solute symporter family protein [Garicola koreensis]
MWIGIKRIRTYDDYNVASRNVSIYPLILTYVGTAIGGSTLLGFMASGYDLGMREQWFMIAILFFGVVMALFMVKRIRRLGEKYRYITIGDVTAHRFGNKARVPTTISVLTAYAAITGMQFVAIGLVLNLVAGVPINLAIIVSAVMLTLKTVFGGLKAVIWQDAVHGTVQTLAVFGMFIAVVVIAGDWGTIRSNAEAMGELENLGLMNIGIAEIGVYALTLGAYQLVRQDLWQRAWAARDLKTVMRGYWISIFLAALTTGVVIWVGVMARYGLGIESEDSSLIYYEVANMVMPFEIVVVMVVALLATVISTADSFFMAGSSSIINDIIRPLLKGTPTQKTLLRWSRVSVVITGIVALGLALAVPELIELWTTGTAMLVSGLLFPALVALYAKRVSGRGAITSMWVGLLISVGWTLAGAPFAHPVFLGLPVSILVYVIYHYVDRERLSEYVGEPPLVPQSAGQPPDDTRSRGQDGGA